LCFGAIWFFVISVRIDRPVVREGRIENAEPRLENLEEKVGGGAATILSSQFCLLRSSFSF
jgi:hypothetical protein